MKIALTQEERRRAVMLLTPAELAEFNANTVRAENAKGAASAAEGMRRLASRTRSRAKGRARYAGVRAAEWPGYADLDRQVKKFLDRRRVAQAEMRKAVKANQTLLRMALKRERAGREFDRQKTRDGRGEGHLGNRVDVRA